MTERGEGEIRQDAALWALIAELEALKTERAAMEAFNEGNGGPGYSDGPFFDTARQIREVARQMREGI